MARNPPPPPHLRLKSVAGRPLPEAFEAALAARLTDPGLTRRFGRLRRRAKPLPPRSVHGLCERLEPLGLEAPRVYAVPYLPPESGMRALALVVQREDEPDRGLFLMRQGGRWVHRPQLEAALLRLDPGGAHLRVAARPP